jgi:hypothetical protein
LLHVARLLQVGAFLKIEFDKDYNFDNNLKKDTMDERSTGRGNK